MHGRASQRFDYVVNECRGRRVLHIGCADAPATRQRLSDGTLLHARIAAVAATTHGIDRDSNGISALQEAGFANVAVIDVEQLVSSLPFGPGGYDVVVVGEILEHLSNPGSFLESIRVLFLDHTRLVITTINAYGAYRILYALLCRRENVEPDHVYYFSRSTLQTLLRRSRFAIEDFGYYPIGDEQRRHIHGTRWLLFAVDRLAAWLSPHFCDGLLLTARMESLLADRSPEDTPAQSAEPCTAGRDPVRLGTTS